MKQINGLQAAPHIAPAPVNGKDSPPLRKGFKNSDVRSREWLSGREVHSLMAAVGHAGRHPVRDKGLLLLMFRHGLRVSEAVALRWDAVDMQGGLLHVTRLKNGVPSTHPLRGPELRALRELRRQYPDSPYVFPSERNAPMTASNVRKMVTRAGQLAKLPFPVHPHMLRHSLGFKLANAGQDTRAIQLYLGHKSITHTVRYTELSPERFKNFFRD